MRAYICASLLGPEVPVDAANQLPRRFTRQIRPRQLLSRSKTDRQISSSRVLALHPLPIPVQTRLADGQFGARNSLLGNSAGVCAITWPKRGPVCLPVSQSGCHCTPRQIPRKPARYHGELGHCYEAQCQRPTARHESQQSGDRVLPQSLSILPSLSRER